MPEITFETLITIGIYILTISALYWRMRLDIAKINVEIADIKCDRIDKWSKHDERQDKDDAILTEILRKLGDLAGDNKVIKTHIEYIKEKIK